MSDTTHTTHLLKLMKIGEEMRTCQKLFFKSEPGTQERRKLLDDSRKLEEKFDVLIQYYRNLIM